jgi:hypothetical protein
MACIGVEKVYTGLWGGNRKEGMMIKCLIKQTAQSILNNHLALIKVLPTGFGLYREVIQKCCHRCALCTVKIECQQLK